MTDKPNLLWVGDACTPTGFARATHKILDTVRHAFNVTVLGINYYGDPYDWPYPVYSCIAGGDAFGVKRLPWMCERTKPDIIVLQNDPWNIPMYLNYLKSCKEYAGIPVVGIVPVDGKNCVGEALKDLTMAVFWTNFALGEARTGGYAGPVAVIPLGVDLETYYPIDPLEARYRIGLPKYCDDAFIVGNVNRNQPRKRWDLTMQYFAEWLTTGVPKPNARLFLHAAPTGDASTVIKQLAEYFGIWKRVIFVEPPVDYGRPESEMRDTYNCFDVQVSTTQGEGFGLTTFEGMACGVPQIVPDWSALGELCQGAAEMIPCTSTAIGPPYVNVIGGIADKTRFIQALDELYVSHERRRELREAGLARVREDRFRWEHIGAAFRDVFLRVAEGVPPAVPESVEDGEAEVVEI
jgi:D-inositol-3-phosphate glycosyltransferase